MEKKIQADAIGIRHHTNRTKTKTFQPSQRNPVRGIRVRVYARESQSFNQDRKIALDKTVERNRATPYLVTKNSPGITFAQPHGLEANNSQRAAIIMESPAYSAQ